MLLYLNTTKTSVGITFTDNSDVNYLNLRAKYKQGCEFLFYFFIFLSFMVI
jgi:hypothetical protein